jgi:hypothetical protein
MNVKFGYITQKVKKLNVIIKLKQLYIRIETTKRNNDGQ